MSFKTLDEIPERYKNLVERLVEQGIIVSNDGELEHPLNEDMLYLIKVMQRMN